MLVSVRKCVEEAPAVPSRDRARAGPVAGASARGGPDHDVVEGAGRVLGGQHVHGGRLPREGVGEGVGAGRVLDAAEALLLADTDAVTVGGQNKGCQF